MPFYKNHVEEQGNVHHLFQSTDAGSDSVFSTTWTRAIQSLSFTIMVFPGVQRGWTKSTLERHEFDFHSYRVLTQNSSVARTFRQRLEGDAMLSHGNESPSPDVKRLEATEVSRSSLPPVLRSNLRILNSRCFKNTKALVALVRRGKRRERHAQSRVLPN